MAKGHLTGGKLLLYILVAGLLAALVGCSNPVVPTDTSPAAPSDTPPSVNTPTPTSAPGPTPGPTLGDSPTFTPADGATPTLESIPTVGPTQAPAIPTPTPTVATSFTEAPDRDLYRLAAELSLGGSSDIPRVVNPEPVSYSEGRQDVFWLVNSRDLSIYQSRFELRLVSPRAYWYVEEGWNVRQQDLERAAATFEQDIYPRVTAAFGQEWSPGVDNDPHLNILNARLEGVGGYFSGSDEYPRSVYQYSNQRETIYINIGSLPVGSTRYLEVLAHELQHAAHWNGDSGEDTWVNEGLSELAVSVAGYQPDSAPSFLRSPPASLVHWPLEQLSASANYGAASLFMHYLSEHYGSRTDLLRLVTEPEDGIAGIDAYLETLGYAVTFRDVFRDWTVANFLDEDQGTYGYGGLDVQARVLRFIDGFSQLSSTIPQYATEYIEVTSSEGPLRLRFQGAVENVLIPVEVDQRGCWWSNSGDSISSTLTRTVDLTGLERAILSYQVWYSVEEDWDYGYVEVSVDGGETWDILQTPHSSPDNPIGNGFGPGYTGESQGWTGESVDLTPYVGREVLLRFHYVTDDAVNGTGLCFRQISVPEAGLVDADRGWRAEGFILTNNRVRQDYIVQVIEMGRANQVTVLPLDDANSGEMVIPRPQELGRLVVAVAALAPKTRQPATYTLTVEPAE